MKKCYANMLLVFVTVIWGGGFLATDGALNALSPFYIMMIRFVGAAIFPVLFCFKKLIHISKREVAQGLLAGLFLFLAFAFQTFGLKYSTPSKNAFLTATNVVFVPYLLWMLWKRKPHKKEVLASVTCLIGIAMLTLRLDSLIISVGDGLSLICALFFALHIITLERFGSNMDAIVLTSLQMICAGVLSTICALLFETPPMQVDSSAIGNIIYLIFISTLLAYLIQTYAQKFTTANTASLILSMEALFASIFSYIFLHEIMTPMMLLGACMIFGSVIYIEYKPKNKQH